VDLEPLDVYKALGDETRYQLFAELLESAAPLSTAELADRLHLHPNTIRPHLERMREAGLIELEVSATGTVGRPCHRYRPAPERRPAGLRAGVRAGGVTRVRAGGPVRAVGRAGAGGHNRPGRPVGTLRDKTLQEENHS